ncbi:zinc finger, CCHC-type containing protein [Tanacetum coccineum]
MTTQINDPNIPNQQPAGRKRSACAACAETRTRCDANCTFAPYFPQDKKEQWLNVKNLFGHGKIKKDMEEKTEKERTLQHLPYSPATNQSYPGRLVAGDPFPRRHVAREKLNGKARWGYVPGRLTRATVSGPQSFSQTNKCHGGEFSRATCRPG